MVLSLIIAGFVMEFVGIALAGLEIAKRRKEVKAYETLPTRVRKTHPVSWDVLKSGTGQVGRRTLRQRVKALERATPDAQRELELRAKAYAETIAKAMTTAAQEDLDRTIDSVRTLLLKTTRPNRTALASIGLLVLGLLLQTIASVIQVVSTG